MYPRLGEIEEQYCNCVIWRENEIDQTDKEKLEWQIVVFEYEKNIYIKKTKNDIVLF